MIDFDKLVDTGGSFAGTASDFSAYKKWAARQSCKHCGAKAADRLRDANGYPTIWITETDCGCKRRAKWK